MDEVSQLRFLLEKRLGELIGKEFDAIMEERSEVDQGRRGQGMGEEDKGWEKG